MPGQEIRLYTEEEQDIAEIDEIKDRKEEEWKERMQDYLSRWRLYPSWTLLEVQ